MAGARPGSAEPATIFGELHPPFGHDEALAAAARCVFCYDAPCTRACPTRIDVPRFLRQILHDNPGGAAETILSENVLGGSCARVCPTDLLCEGACVDRTLHGEPVPVGSLQRYAVDHADRMGLGFFTAGEESGRRVAVVGAGPAGLACAFELRRRGHAVNIFEAADEPGGLNRRGIALYKLDPEYALAEAGRVTDLGAELRCGEAVHGEAVVKMLGDYDAVFLGVGLGGGDTLGLPGEEGPGVLDALDFIARAHEGPAGVCEVGRSVVVLGGGNTAIDAALQAMRLGAECVTLVYRRTEDAMPAYRHELELARANGLICEWLATPIAFNREGEKLSALRCQRVRAEGEGRGARLVPVEGGEFSLPCDMAIRALGQTPLREFLGGIEGLVLDGACVVVDPATGATGVPGLYAGGDCVNGGAEVVDAVQAGKLAGRAIATRFAQDGSAGRPQREEES